MSVNLLINYKNLTPKKLVQIPAAKELARRQFYDFVDYTFEDYRFNWHHKYLCTKLQDFYDQKIKNLAVFLPPQHGKSELCSKLLPAYVLGKNPNTKIAGVSYSHDLSSGFNKAVQRYIDNDTYYEIFPNTILNSKNPDKKTHPYAQNNNHFETVGYNGHYLSTGIGGSLTGKKVDLLIIDDPLKDLASATSLTIQAKNWDWFNSVALTRINNQGQILLIQTRWDEYDLGGMILEYYKEGFDVVSIPAIKTTDAVTCEGWDTRKKGEALWPEEHSVEKIRRIETNSKKTFLSLFQQNPQSPTDVYVFKGNSRMDVIPSLTLEKFYGVDFGYSNSECAICEVQIDKDNNVIYAKEVYYDLETGNDEIIKILENWGVKRRKVYYDSAEPKSGAKLKTKLNAHGTAKFNNSVQTMILELKAYTLILEGRNFEFERLHYRFKQYPDGSPRNEEDDKNNHLFKALMYAVWGYLYQNVEEATAGAKKKKRKRPTMQDKYASNKPKSNLN